MCYTRHKQTAVNKWVRKQVKKKIQPEILKITCEESYVQERIFKDSTFSQVLLKDFTETFQNTY